MHPESIFSHTAVSNPYRLRRLTLGKTPTHAPPTPSLPPYTHAHATPRTTIYPPPQSACGQTQNNNVISTLKGTRAGLRIVSPLAPHICVIFSDAAENYLKKYIY